MTMKLTVVVPTYNLGDYFAGMLKALARQTVPFELWLIDDGSTDGTQQVARDFARGRDWVHVHAFETHVGVSAARNYGLAHATGDAIAFVDGDDAVAPDFVEALLAGFTPGVVATAVGYDWWSRTGRASNHYQTLTQHAMFDQVSQHGTAVGGYVWNKAFSRAALQENGVTFDETLALAEDYLFTASFVARTPGLYAYLPRVLYTKHNRPNSTIHTANWAARQKERRVFARIHAMGKQIVG